jgi:hypothetical protein
MDPDQLFYGRALARIQFLMAFLSVAGLVAAAIYGGWRWAAGYLLGAIASYANFRWLKQMVSALSDAATSKSPGTRAAAIFGLRFLLLGISAYAIFNFSTVSLAAAFVGLFVSVTAVILEILYELIYART